MNRGRSGSVIAPRCDDAWNVREQQGRQMSDLMGKSGIFCMVCTKVC